MRRLIVIVLALLTAAALAGSASSTHGKNVWSGRWTTSTGTVQFKLISDTQGVADIQRAGGRPCDGSTDYFRGGYTTKAGDHGSVVGCTINWRRMVARWNTNLASARDGTFDISYGDNTFSGRYQEDGGGSGPYTGRFDAHVSGDGANKGGTTVPGEGAVYEWSFRTYANNVRVVKPLVGPWQLTVVKGQGSGKFEIQNGKFVGNPGTISITSDPHSPRYRAGWIKARVVGFHSSSSPTGHKPSRDFASLDVEITSSSQVNGDCAPGALGKLVMVSTDALLDNGKPADYVTLGTWTKKKCLGFVMGWTNADGGARTDPSHGGPPDGGQWAVVNVKLPD